MKHNYRILWLTVITLFFVGCSVADDNNTPTVDSTPTPIVEATNVQITSTPTDAETTVPIGAETTEPVASTTSTQTVEPSATPSLIPSATLTSTPLPTNTTTPTPPPSCVVTESSVNVRAGNGTHFEPIDIALQDDILPVIAFDSSSSWYLVEVNGRKGWVAESVCAGNRPAGGLPLPATVPSTYTPTPSPTPTNTPSPMPTHTPPPTMIPTATRSPRTITPITDAQQFCFDPPNDQWGTFDNLEKWEIEVFGDFTAQIEISLPRGGDNSEPNFHSVGTGIGILNPNDRLDWSRIRTAVDANLPRGKFLIGTAHTRNGSSWHSASQTFDGEVCDWIGNGECMAYLNFPVTLSMVRTNGKIRLSYEVHNQFVLLEERDDDLPYKIHVYLFQLAWGSSTNCSTISNWTIQELP